MALAQELNIKDQGPLSDESKGLVPYGDLIRDYEPTPGTQWRFGKPNYARVNKLYFENRSKVHKEGTLEYVVNKLVKNWEIETHHIADSKQWKTVDTSIHTLRVNGGPPLSAQDMSEQGPYNALIGDINQVYLGTKLTFEQSNKIWGGVFSEGYAFEVTEVLSGPPTVTFKWRHFGKFSGSYIAPTGKKYEGKGELLDLFGMCIAKVNDQLVIEHLDVYYNPLDLMTPLMTKANQVSTRSDDGGAMLPVASAPTARRLSEQRYKLQGTTTKEAGQGLDQGVVDLYKKTFADHGGDKEKVCAALGLDGGDWIDGLNADGFCMKYLGRE